VGNQTICSGGSLTLTASGANTYTWLPGSINSPVSVFSPTVSSTYTVQGSNSFSCTASVNVQVIVSPCTNIAEKYDNDYFDFVVYPNPNNGVFSIKGNSVDSFSLYDHTGKLITIIESKEGDSNTQTIENLTKGIYYLKGNGVVKKIVVL
jgi:hypothetical protein